MSTLKLVEVLWLDVHGSQGWTDKAEVARVKRSPGKKPKLDRHTPEEVRKALEDSEHLIRSTGYVIHDTKRTLVLTDSILPWGDVGGLTVIPRSLVRAVMELSPRVTPIQT